MSDLMCILLHVRTLFVSYASLCFRLFYPISFYIRPHLESAKKDIGPTRRTSRADGADMPARTEPIAGPRSPVRYFAYNKKQVDSDIYLL